MQPITITSIDDPRIDVFRNVRDADLRGRDHLFLAESELVLSRLLHQPQRILSIFLSSAKFDSLRSVLAPLPPAIPIYLADLKLMSRITGFHIHRGVLTAGRRLPSSQLTLHAVLPPIINASPAGQTLLLAEALTNVDNMGSLFRNAAALNVSALILSPECCDPLYRKSIRVSMGHALSIPYVQSENWLADLAQLKGWGFTLLAAETTVDALPLWHAPRASHLAVLVGSEGHGISPQALRLCDARIHIPMARAVSSLNVATAAAIVLYELLRAQSSSAR